MIGARDLYEQALKVEPENIDALAGVATTLVFEVLNGYYQTGNEQRLLEAEELLARTLAVEPRHLAETIAQRHARGRYFSVVVVAEGARLAAGIDEQIVAEKGKKDEFGHVRLGGIGTILAQELEKRTGFEARAVVLGHIQRGGSPTAFDRMLATRYGIGAIDAVHRHDFGKMVALRGTDIVTIPLKEALSRTRVVGQDLIDVAAGLREPANKAV